MKIKTETQRVKALEKTDSIIKGYLGKKKPKHPTLTEIEKEKKKQRIIKGLLGKKKK